MAVNPGPGAIGGRERRGPGMAPDGQTERMMVAPATLDKLGRAYIATYHGPHGDAPAVDTMTGPMDMSAAGRLMSPALLAAHYQLGKERRFGETRVADLSEGRSRRLRARDSDRHRLREHADGLRDGAAAPARGGLQVDHEPGTAGAARPERRAARYAARHRRRQHPRRHRRGVDPHSARPTPSTPGCWRRSSACCRACWPTRARWRSTRAR